MGTKSTRKVTQSDSKNTDKAKPRTTKLKTDAEVIPEVANQQNLPISTSDMMSSFEVITSTSPTPLDITPPVLRDNNEVNAELAIRLLQEPPPDLPLMAYEAIDGLTVDQLLDRADGCFGAIWSLARKGGEQLWLAGQAWSAAKAQVGHGDWIRLITERGYSDSSVRQAIRVFNTFDDINIVNGLTTTQAKIAAGVVKPRPPRNSGPAAGTDQEPQGAIDSPQATSVRSDESGPGRVRVVIEDHNQGHEFRGADFQTRIVDTPSMTFGDDLPAITDPRSPTPNPTSGRRSDGRQQRTTRQPDVSINPPEEEVPVDWAVPSEPFQPPGPSVDLPPLLATSVEWLRQAALFFGWMVADNGLLPPLQYRGDLKTFNHVIDAWKASRSTITARRT